MKLYLLLLFFIARFGPSVMLEIEPNEETVVRKGDELKILCKAPMTVNLNNCHFEIPDNSRQYNIDYYSEGYCGIRLSNVRETDDGNYTCRAEYTFGDMPIVSQNSVRFIVAKEPSIPQLRLSRNTYRVGEKMDITCYSDGGRPPANLSLLLDNEQIYAEKPLIYVGADQSPHVGLKLSRTVKVEDHGKTLSCTATHITHSQPVTAIRQIIVQFPPEKQAKIERFGDTIGQACRVKVTVRAYPLPNFIWRIDGQRILSGQTDKTNRIQTSGPTYQGYGFWTVDFNIGNLQSSHAAKGYILEATNGLGSASYGIVLSDDS